MDEYLFIVLAKLRADRLKLEREARAESCDRHAQEEAFEQLQERRSPRARRFVPGAERFQEI
jgi:hypothetical protein